jgi:prefoldin alpha subunit
MERKEVPMESLNLEQLTSVGKQIDQEINSYSSYYTSLKVALAKFFDNKEYIKDIGNCKDKEILVPITSSLYIPGKCGDIKSIMLEVGANYFVGTNIEKADSFCDRKIKIVKESMDKIDAVIKTKNDQLTFVNHNIIQKSTAAQQQKK